MTCCDLKCGLITGTVVGALVAVLGGILIPVGDMFIENTVHKETVLENGTLAFDTWTSVDIAIYRQFWLYNVQNPDAVLSEGAKPVLVQKGPYTYKTRFIPKRNITFNDNFTVSFILPAGAIFEPSMSVGTEEDVFTSLNLAVAGVYSLLDHKLANLLIQRSNSSLFQNRTVKELLWGYKDPMLGSTLGVFYPYNDTLDGPYTVFTGKDDINKVATIDRWQGETSLSYWNDPYCNKINGSDGSSFHPFLDKKEPLFFFSPDICRSISGIYERTVNLKGIDVYRYMLPPEALASPVENPDNMCYCTDHVLTKNCTTAGLLDLTACRGTPVFISLPHFLFGSDDLHQGVIGMNPSLDEHSIFLDVEPHFEAAFLTAFWKYKLGGTIEVHYMDRNSEMFSSKNIISLRLKKERLLDDKGITGFTLRFAKRLQLNMLYGPSNSIQILNKIKDNTIFPILWVNETAVLDDETADMFKKELIARMDLLEGFQIGLIVVGLVLFISCLIGSIVVCNKPEISKVSLVVK